jgi:hypothetical protein
MKVLSFTILATVLLALFIPNIAATNDVRGHVEEKEDIGGGHRALGRYQHLHKYPTPLSALAW